MLQEENGRGEAEAEIDGAVVEDTEREIQRMKITTTGCAVQPKEQNDQGRTLQQRRGRKRQRNAEGWRRNVQERLRDTGEAHINNWESKAS